ncbi:MAG: Scr1 family TA system antitoxin-like transcriptional regulator [Pseudonocardia sp.]
MQEFRQARQQRLFDAGQRLRLAVVIEEDALDRPVGGPEVMRDQLDQLLAMAGRDNVTVQVMPRSVAVHDGATIHQVGAETHLRAGTSRRGSPLRSGPRSGLAPRMVSPPCSRKQ